MAPFWKLDVDEVWGLEQSHVDNIPMEAESFPTFKVYGASGFIVGGTCEEFETDDYVGLYKFSFTPTSPSFTRGKPYTVVVQYVVDGDDRQSHHEFILT